MLTLKRIGTAAAVALALGWVLAPAARALTNSDRPAALITYPYIDVATTAGRDTLLQMSNTSTSLITAKCFYINANSHCSNTGLPCTTGASCQVGQTFGVCAPGWNVTDFFVAITREQPLAWIASRGLNNSNLPLRNRFCSNNAFQACSNDGQCPGGTCVQTQTNAGTLVPPTPEDPFMGELRCLQIDPTTGLPPETGRTNSLTGQATLHVQQADGTIDVATYSAVGLLATGDTDGNTTLTLGIDSEYASCANVLVVNHLFDLANDPIDPALEARTTLSLVPCSADLTGVNPSIGQSTAQFLVFNEFEQRFSASRTVNCQLKSQLSLIDTSQESRSIWSAGVSGTVAGQTRIRGVGSGLMGAAKLNLSGAGEGNTAFDIHQDSGDREAGDVMQLP